MQLWVRWHAYCHRVPQVVWWRWQRWWWSIWCACWIWWIVISGIRMGWRWAGMPEAISGVLPRPMGGITKVWLRVVVRIPISIVFFVSSMIMGRSGAASVPISGFNVHTSGSAMLPHWARRETWAIIVVSPFSFFRAAVHHIRTFSSSRWGGSSRAWRYRNFVDKIAHIWCRNRRVGAIHFQKMEILGRKQGNNKRRSSKGIIYGRRKVCWTSEADGDLA